MRWDLPKLDIPVNVLTWEISLPDRLEVRQFGGNALAAELFPAAAQNFLAFDVDGTETESNSVAQTAVRARKPGGRTDQAGSSWILMVQ